MAARYRSGFVSCSQKLKKKNTEAGAFSVTVTHSRKEIEGKKYCQDSDINTFEFLKVRTIDVW